MLETQFAGKVKLKYTDFGTLHSEVNEDATLSPSEQVLFEQVMYKGITEVAVLTGNDVLKVDSKKRTVENVVVGAFTSDVQILDLDDIEMFDKIGLSKDGVGATTKGSLAHEIAEGNKYQQEGKELTKKYNSTGYAQKLSHEYGIDIENKVNGTERDIDENLSPYIFKGHEFLDKERGSTGFGTIHLYYKTGSKTTKVSYDFNRDQIKKEAPQSSKFTK